MLIGKRELDLQKNIQSTDKKGVQKDIQNMGEKDPRDKQTAQVMKMYQI